MAVQPATTVPTSSEACAGLRLNMLPVVFRKEIQRDVVYSLPYAGEAWEPLSERARGGKEFHITRHVRRSSSTSGALRPGDARRPRPIEGGDASGVGAPGRRCRLRRA
jgi:hypothetical protein